MTTEELLRDKSIQYEKSGKDLVVKCLNPEHDDTNPSMRIDEGTGMFNCFSCGFKGNLFTHFGRPQTGLENAIARIQNKIDDIRSQTTGFKMPTAARRFEGNWTHNGRVLKANTLKKWDAFTWDGGGYKGYIVFPLYKADKRIFGFVGRYLGTDQQRMIDNKPKYLLQPQGVKTPFIPSRAKPLNGRVVIVEGLLDAMNLWDKGLYNAVAAFGVNKVTTQKLNSLKLQGVSGVDIMFDGDTAGRQGAEVAFNLATELEFDVRIIPLAEGQDPGSLTQNEVDLKIAKYYA